MRTCRSAESRSQSRLQDRLQGRLQAWVARLRFPDPILVTGRDANARQADSSVLGGVRECRRVVALCCLCRCSLFKFGIQKCRVLSG